MKIKVIRTRIEEYIVDAETVEEAESKLDVPYSDMLPEVKMTSFTNYKFLGKKEKI